MSQFAPRFDKEFDAPAVDSGFESLLSLAKALIPRMPELEKEIGTLELFLPYLASCTLEHIGKHLPSSDLSRVWTQFFNKAEIEALSPKARDILTRTREESLRLASLKPVAADELSTAHRKAHAFVDETLKLHGVELPLNPVTLVVSFDQSARTFCASTARLLGQVQWVYQPVVHALYGALIPEIILAHEYLSHIAPRNALLGEAVTEKWLVIALMRAFRERWATDRSQLWKKTIWSLMRDALENHLQSLTSARPSPSLPQTDCPRGVKEFALILYGRSKPAFWRFTAALLTASSNITAAQMNEYFRHLVANDEFFYNSIKISKSFKIRDLIS